MSRLLPRYAALALLLWATGASAADPQKDVPKSTSSIEPGTTVVWDPDQGGWQSQLPFDVHFYASIPIDENVQSVDGRFVGHTSPLFCTDVFPQTRTLVDYGYGPRDLIASEERQIQRMGGWARNPKRPADRAALKIKSLLPNRYYCFEFTKVRNLDAEDPEFQARLRAAVDQVLRKFDDVTGADSFPPGAYEDLRRAIIQAIESELGPGERLVIESGKFLDATTQTLDLPASERASFNRLLTEQSQRGRQIENQALAPASPLSHNVKPALEEVFASAALGPLRDSADSATVKNLVAWTALQPTPTTLEELSQGAIDLKGALAEQQSDADAEVTRAEPWDDIWSADQLAVRRRNLESTMGSLDALAVIAAGVDDQSGLAVPAAEVEGLEAVLKRAKLAINFALRAGLPIIAENLEARDEGIGSLVEYLTRVEIERLLIEGSTTADFATQSNWYLGFDLGVAWAQDIEEFFGYLGTNIYFRPVNKKAPLSWSDFRRGQRVSELFKRLSVTVGVTVANLEEEVGPTGQFQPPSQGTLTQGLIGDRQLVFGVGMRLNRYLRFSGGALVFKDQDPNPLIDRSKLAWAPLLSISIDFDITSGLQSRFNPNK